MRNRSDGRVGSCLLAAGLLFLCGVAGAQVPAKPGAGAHSLKSKASKVATAPIKPSGKSEMLKVVSGSRTVRYYKASKAAPVIFPVVGRTTVRVLSRLVPAPGASAAGAYGLRVELDGKVILTVKVAAKASKKAKLNDAGISGLKKTSISVPPGKHSLRVMPEEDGVILAVKGLRGIAKKKVGARIPFAPEGYERALRLHVKDQESTVYRFTSEKPVEMTVLGPLSLRVLTRLDFSPANGVTQSYVVQAQLDGKIWKSFPIKSRASHVATYPEMGEVAPGMSRSFDLKVPSGSHRLVLAVTGTTAGGATVQILMPRPATRVSAGG